MDVFTTVVVSCMGVCVCMLYYECLRARWIRRKKHIEEFKKSLDEPREGLPIKKKRTPFIDI